MQVFVQQPNM